MESCLKKNKTKSKEKSKTSLYNTNLDDKKYFTSSFKYNNLKRTNI